MSTKIEPLEVVVKGSDTVVGYACPNCNAFAGMNRGLAERCCNRKCDDCGAEFEDSVCFIYCAECRKMRDAAREQEAFDKATKIPEADYDGWLYYDGEYHEDLDALADHWAQNELEWPQWAWACRKVEFKIDVDTVLEHALQDHYEDARDGIPGHQERELQTFLDAWCAKQAIVSWEEDRTRVVMLEPREMGEDDNG